MQQIKRMLTLLFVLFSVVGCDQATKSVAQRHLSAAPPISFLKDTIRLDYVENPGAFLSLGANLPDTTQYWIFTIAVALILGGLLLFVLHKLQKIHTPALIAFALFMGGGIGNFIDRLTNEGRVIDFMNIGIGNLRTGIFNVADMALIASLLILSLVGFQVNTTHSPSERQSYDQKDTPL
jgi:signal peptidase II